MKRLPHLLTALSLSLLPGLSFAATLQIKVSDRDGQVVPGAVVEVQTSSGALPPMSPPRQVTISQLKMKFVPRVTLVQPGTRVVFTNQDHWDHHVHGTVGGLARMLDAVGFQFRLAGWVDNKPMSSSEVVFDKPGVTLLGCFLHSSMRGYVVVAESPWAAITGEDGVAVIDGLPAGPAVVKLWQADEVAELTPQPVVLGETPVMLSRQLSVAVRRH